jgi:hypothetical protein
MSELEPANRSKHRIGWYSAVGPEKQRVWFGEMPIAVLDRIRHPEQVEGYPEVAVGCRHPLVRRRAVGDWLGAWHQMA